MTVATMKKPIATADRPDVNAAADFFEQLASQMSNEERPLTAEQQRDRAAACWRHARTLRRIACGNRAGHVNLYSDRPCTSCGAFRRDDEVPS